MHFCHTEECITSTCFLLHCCLFFYKPMLLNLIRSHPPPPLLMPPRTPPPAAPAAGAGPGPPVPRRCAAGLTVKRGEISEWVTLVDDCVREVATPRLVNAVAHIRKLTGMQNAKVCPPPPVGAGAGPWEARPSPKGFARYFGDGLQVRPALPTPLTASKRRRQDHCVCAPRGSRELPVLPRGRGGHPRASPTPLQSPARPSSWPPKCLTDRTISASLSDRRRLPP